MAFDNATEHYSIVQVKQCIKIMYTRMIKQKTVL